MSLLAACIGWGVKDAALLLLLPLASYYCRRLRTVCFNVGSAVPLLHLLQSSRISSALLFTHTFSGFSVLRYHERLTVLNLTTLWSLTLWSRYTRHHRSRHHSIKTVQDACRTILRQRGRQDRARRSRAAGAIDGGTSESAACFCRHLRNRYVMFKPFQQHHQKILTNPLQTSTNTSPAPSTPSPISKPTNKCHLSLY